MTSSELTNWMVFYQLEQEDEREAIAEAKRKVKEEMDKAK